MSDLKDLGLHRFPELPPVIQQFIKGLVNSIASHYGTYDCDELVKQLSSFHDTFNEEQRQRLNGDHLKEMLRELPRVTKHTRAGKYGKILMCPACGDETRAGHFAWSGFVCCQCNQEIDKEDWLIVRPATLDDWDDEE